MNEPVEKPVTDAQMGVLELMQQGFRNKDIAERLDISDRTVSTVIRRTYKKYGIPLDMNSYFFINTLIKRGVLKTEKDG